MHAIIRSKSGASESEREDSDDLQDGPKEEIP